MKNQPYAKRIIIVMLLILATAAPSRVQGRGKNHPPVIAERAIVVTTWAPTESGQLEEVTIEIEVKASDPDGDVLTFKWTASNGEITGQGPKATWKRKITSSGEPVRGIATVVVTDGRGGRAIRTVVRE